MKKLNTYINEAWSGVKKQSLKSEIEAWCDEMGIKNYTINSQGEIDVDGNVSFNNSNIKDLPYKFGTINGYFSLTSNQNLTSLKNCPNKVNRWFACDDCKKLDSLEGCPKEVGDHLWCNGCKRKFTIEEIQRHCNVKKTKIYI